MNSLVQESQALRKRKAASSTPALHRTPIANSSSSVLTTAHTAVADPDTLPTERKVTVSGSETVLVYREPVSHAVVRCTTAPLVGTAVSGGSNGVAAARSPASPSAPSAAVVADGSQSEEHLDLPEIDVADEKHGDQRQDSVASQRDDRKRQHRRKVSFGR